METQGFYICLFCVCICVIYAEFYCCFDNFCAIYI